MTNNGQRFRRTQELVDRRAVKVTSCCSGSSQQQRNLDSVGGGMMVVGSSTSARTNAVFSWRSSNTFNHTELGQNARSDRRMESWSEFLVERVYMLDWGGRW